MSDTFLKTAIGIAALSVGYYYAIHLPGADAAARDAAAVKAIEERIAGLNKAAADEERERARRAGFESCKSVALSTYDTRWDETCKGLHEADIKARQGCLNLGYAEAYCENAYSVRPAKDCRLPSETADDYDNGREADIQMCLAAAKEGLTL